MINQEDINKIKSETEHFFSKMTILVDKIDINPPILDLNITGDEKENKEAVELSVKLDEPQILIGQGGQTLFEIQRLLRMLLNKKLQKVFYLNLDINDYKKNKTEYLKDIAKTAVNEVLLNKTEKVLPAMPAYERRIIHEELSKRTDVLTESRGEGENRRIVIIPK